MGKKKAAAGKRPSTPRPPRADAASIVREHFEIFNRHELDRGASRVTEDSEWVDVPSGAMFRGPQGYKQFNETWIVAFPDARTTLKNVFAVGDRVAVEFDGIGTHTGPLKGSAGEIPATHKHVRLEFCEIFRIKDGRVASARLYYDAASLLRQIGLAPGASNLDSR